MTPFRTPAKRTYSPPAIEWQARHTISQDAMSRYFRGDNSARVRGIILLSFYERKYRLAWWEKALLLLSELSWAARPWR